MAQRVLLTMQEIQVQSLGQEAILEKGMVTHSSILVSPLQKKRGSKKYFGEGNVTPLQYSCLENPMDGGTWKAAVHGVTEGWTRLR